MADIARYDLNDETGQLLKKAISILQFGDDRFVGKEFEECIDILEEENDN